MLAGPKSYDENRLTFSEEEGDHDAMAVPLKHLAGVSEQRPQLILGNVCRGEDVGRFNAVTPLKTWTSIQIDQGSDLLDLNRLPGCQPHIERSGFFVPNHAR